jgi:hypothetical protein
MRWLTLAVLAAGSVGCGKVIYGGGDLFIWNGSNDRFEVDVNGRSSARFSLAAHTGQRVEDAVAGSYTVTQSKDDKQRVYDGVLKDGGTLLVNLEGAACFVRTDISGMYQAGKERVRLLQSYDQNDVLVLDLPIPVMPGEAVPATRPKSTNAFQRLSDVPCNLLRDQAGMAEYVRRSR